MRHFLDLKSFTKDTLEVMLYNGLKMKAELKEGKRGKKPLLDKSVAMIFEKPSTRTRVSFEVCISQLGGSSVGMSASDLHLKRGESSEDTARVLSRYVDAIVIRCFKHETLLKFAENGNIPVINALTDQSHPCQLMADLITMIEFHGSLEGQRVAWIGDGNNMANSWIEAAVQFNFQLRLACPKGYEPNKNVLEWAHQNGGDIFLADSVFAAVDNAKTVVTDVWVSMGDDKKNALKEFKPFQVNSKVMQAADKGAIFMHCLPAWRGMEVTADVIDGPQSVVFEEAENRLHAQKAILSWCLSEI